MWDSAMDLTDEEIERAKNKARKKKMKKRKRQEAHEEYEHLMLTLAKYRTGGSVIAAVMATATFLLIVLGGR